MKLLDIKVNHFGKLQDYQMEFQDGINLIYGENESGKSTIHTFIRSMLFGMERGRGRASAHDTFSRYEPWENGNYYSGELRFECNNKSFRLQRNFDRYSKGAALLCETDGEELSVEDGDLEMLLDGLTASSYENTLYIGQLHAPTGAALASELKNYAASYYVTGESDIDLSAARELLLAEKRTVDKAAKQALQEKQKKRETLEQEAAYIWRELHQIDQEMEEVRQTLEERGREKQEAEGQEPGQKKRFLDRLRPAGWRVHPLEILGILAVVALAFILIPKPWNAFVTVIVALLGTIYVWNRMKISKHRAKTESETILEELTPENELVSTDKLRWKLEHLAGERTEKQIEYENLQEQLQEMDEMGADYRELQQKRDALLLAVERLEQVAAGMQKQLTIRLNEKASELMAQMTDGKYNRLSADEDLQMSILYQSRKIAVEQLSQGTLEQVYFALRMAVAELLYREKFPVILDDTFAFYDDERLAGALEWLAGCGHQVLLFTCHRREERILKEKGIRYTVRHLS